MSLFLQILFSTASGSKCVLCSMADLLPPCRELVDALSVEHAKALFQMLTDPSKARELCRTLKHRIRADADAAITRHLHLSNAHKSSAYAVSGQTGSVVPAGSPRFPPPLPSSSFSSSPPLSTPSLSAPPFSSFSPPPLPPPLSPPPSSLPLPPLPPPPFPPPLSPPPLPPPPFPPPFPVSPSFSPSFPCSVSLSGLSSSLPSSSPSPAPASSSSPVVVVLSSGTMNHAAPSEPEDAAVQFRPNLSPDVGNSGSTSAQSNQDVFLGPATREIDPHSRAALPRRRRRFRHSALGPQWAWTDAMIRERSRSRSDTPVSGFTGWISLVTTSVMMHTCQKVCFLLAISCLVLSKLLRSDACGSMPHFLLLSLGHRWIC